MVSGLGACNTEAGTDAWEFMEYYPDTAASAFP
jgi:hypothetical protein